MYNTYFRVLIILLVFIFSKFSSADNEASIFAPHYAVKYYKNVAEKARAEVFVKEALKLHKAKLYAQAVIQWKNALRFYADADIYYRFGDTLFCLNSIQTLKSAISAYKNAILLGHTQKKLVYYNMACAYSQLEDIVNAACYLDMAILEGYTAWKHIQTDPDLRFLRKKIYTNKKQFTKYFHVLTRFISDDFAFIQKRKIKNKPLILKYLISARTLYNKREYHLSILELLRVLEYYADGDIYFQIGEILKNLPFSSLTIHHKLIGETFLIAAKLGCKNPGLAYYNAAGFLSENKYLELAIQNGYTAMDSIRKDPWMINLCFSSICRNRHNNYELQNIRNSKLFSYCFSSEDNSLTDITGKWDFDLLVHLLTDSCTKYYLFRDNGSLKISYQLFSIQLTINQTGTYKIQGNKILVHLTYQERISSPPGMVSHKKTKNINVRDIIEVIARNKYILIVKLASEKKLIFGIGNKKLIVLQQALIKRVKNFFFHSYSSIPHDLLYQRE